MARNPLEKVVASVRRVVEAQEAARQSDRELIHAYAASKDQQAFAALVKRHGSLVFGVCRRMLRQTQDAEDAFQATFIILAKRARSLSGRDSVAGWLHRVAFLTALHARRAARRRIQHEGEAQLMETVDPARAAAWKEIQQILDEEILRLPAKYREPFVLCCLENLGCAEVGRRMGLKEGTVWTRLAEARKRLQKQLTRRGVALATVLAAVATAEAGPMLPADLVATTIRSVLAYQGSAQCAGIVSRQVAALVRGASAAALVGSAKLAAVLTLGLGAVIGVTGFYASHRMTGGTRPTGQETVVSGEPAQAKKTQPARLDRFGDPLPEGAVSRLGSTRWRVANWRILDQITELSFAPDGKSVLAHSSSGPSRFDLETGRLVDWKEPTPVPKQVGAVNKMRLQTIVAVGGLLATTDGLGVIHVANRNASQKSLALQANGRDVFSMDVTSDGKALAAVAKKDGRPQPVQVWDLTTGKIKFELPRDFIAGYGLILSPDNKYLVAVGYSTIQVWDVASGKQVSSIRGSHSNAFSNVYSFSSDSKLLATASQFSAVIELWDVATGRLQNPQEGHLGRLRAVAFSPDGAHVATSAADDFTTCIWDCQTGASVAQISRHNAWATGFNFSNNGKTLFTLWNDCNFRTLDAMSGREVHSKEMTKAPDGADYQTLYAQFCGNGKNIVSIGAMKGYQDNLVRVWDTSTGSLESRRIRARFDAHHAVSWDGRILAANVAPVPVRSMLPIGLSPIQLENLRTGEGLVTLPAMSGQTSPVAFSSDSRLLVVSNFGELDDPGMGGKSAGPVSTMRVLEISSGAEVLRFRTHSNLSAAFSPDGRLLAFNPMLREVVVWDLRASPEIKRIEGFDSDVCKLTFSHKGDRLVSGHGNGTLLIWPISKPATPVLDGAVAAKLWNDLAADAPKAFRARGALASIPDAAVEVLKGRLKPAQPPDQQQIDKLLADLDSKNFATREAAQQALVSMGNRAMPVLKRALAAKPGPEASRRIGELLDGLKKPISNSKDLQEIRAVAVLEDIGTERARALLNVIASGAPEAMLTQEAKSALERLTSNDSHGP